MVITRSTGWNDFTTKIAVFSRNNVPIFIHLHYGYFLSSLCMTVRMLKFIYFEKATKFCEISTLLLTGTTLDKSKAKISQNFVAFSEYINFKAPLKYLEGALNFKTWPQLKNITITNIQNSTPNSSFDALSKWHDPDITEKNLHTNISIWCKV